MSAPVYAGTTGNGTSIHLSRESGRVVTSLCGKRVWTGTTPVDDLARLAHRLCRRCARSVDSTR